MVTLLKMTALYYKKAQIINLWEKMAKEDEVESDKFLIPIHGSKKWIVIDIMSINVNITSTNMMSIAKNWY